MKKKLLSEKEFNKMQDFQSKWRKVIMYAATNGFEIPEFMEEIAVSGYHLDDHIEEFKKQTKNEKAFVDKVFITLYTHGDWDEQNALDEALIHAHIELLDKKGQLTIEKERELRLQCSDCANCVCCDLRLDYSKARSATLQDSSLPN